MSATNTTTNYGLPIFIETDKPAWLVDFNGAMRTIDAALKTNADAIATKSPILTFNDTNEIDFTKTGDIVTAHLASGVSDKVGRALVTPISAPTSDEIVSVNTNGQQDRLLIGSGLFNDGGTLKAVDLNLDDRGGYTSFTGFVSGTSYNAGTIYKALNSDGSIGKIYGNFNFRSTLSSNTVLHLDTGIIVQAPETEYTINSVGLSLCDRIGGYSVVNMTINTNGHVIIDTTANANMYTYVYVFPSLYIFKDFGDTQ